MKCSKKHVISLVFCMLSEATSIVASDNSGRFVLLYSSKEEQQDPYFLAREHAFLIETIKEQIIAQPIRERLNYDTALSTFVENTKKIIKIYDKKNPLFCLTECIVPFCELTRAKPIDNLRNDFCRLLVYNIIVYLKNNDTSNKKHAPLCIISNAARGFLMEYAILKEFKNRIHNNPYITSKKIEFHCIDPYFQFIGNGEYKPFTKDNKAFVPDNIAFIALKARASNDSNNEKKALFIFNKLIIMKAIDQLVRWANEKLNIDALVYLYLSSIDFIKCNKTNKNNFPFCYTVDLVNVLNDFDSYDKKEYKLLHDFVDSRKQPNNPSTMYFVDRCEHDQHPAIYRKQL